MLAGLFGSTRQLYKRLAQFSLFEDRPLYERLARRPYPWLARCSVQFAELASQAIGTPVAAHEILFDAPPVEREVQFNVDVYSPKQDRFRPLAEISPVSRTLAKEQFDDYVKRVRIFVHPRLAAEVRALKNLPEIFSAAVERTGV